MPAASALDRSNPQFSALGARYLRRYALTLKAAGAETASTTPNAVDLGDTRTVSLTLAVSAASGTSPTLSVAIQMSDDDTNYYTVGTFFNGGFQYAGVAAGTNITGAATLYATIPAGRFIRYASTISGTTPSFTYSLVGSAA